MTWLEAIKMIAEMEHLEADEDYENPPSDKAMMAAIRWCTFLVLWEPPLRIVLGDGTVGFEWRHGTRFVTLDVGAESVLTVYEDCKVISQEHVAMGSGVVAKHMKRLIEEPSDGD